MKIKLTERERALIIRNRDQKNGLQEDRHISPDEGRAFEIHTQTCGGCEYCRPSRGVL